MAGSPFGAGSAAFHVAIDPNGKFAYVDNYASANVSAYTINATSGALTPVAGSPFGAPSGPINVAVDPKGKFVYVPNDASNSVSAYTILGGHPKCTTGGRLKMYQGSVAT